MKVVNSSAYITRSLFSIMIDVDKNSELSAVQGIAVSLKGPNGKYYDAQSGLFVLPDESFTKISDLSAVFSATYRASLDIPRAVSMTMEAGNYTVHAVGYDDSGFTMKDANSSADITSNISLNVPSLKTGSMEIYPLSAFAQPSKDYTDLTVNGTSVFVEGNNDSYTRHNEGDYDTGPNSAKYHVARVATPANSQAHVVITTNDTITSALVRPERIVKNVTYSGNTLTFDVDNSAHTELARNVVINVTTNVPLNNTLPANSDPKYNLKKYAYFHLFIEDLETNKPVVDGNQVINIMNIDPTIDQTGATKVTDKLNAIFANPSFVGKTLYVPNGVYLSGALVLPTNNTSVYLDNGALILGTGDRADYPPDKLPASSITSPTDRYFEWGTDYGEVMSYSRQIYISKANNVKLFGHGTINANGFTARFDHGAGNAAGYNGPQDDGKPIETLRIQDSTNITVNDVYLRNSPAWTVHPLRVDKLNITGVKITDEWPMNSTDGFDIDSSTNVLIDKAYYYGSDDGFVMKGTANSGGRLYTTIGDDNSRVQDPNLTPYNVPDQYLNRTYQLYAGPTAYVTAQNSVLIAEANTPTRIGTESNNVSIHDITFKNNDCLDALVAISITPKDDAEVYNVNFIGNIYDRPFELFEIQTDPRGYKYNTQTFAIQGGGYGNTRDANYNTFATTTGGKSGTPNQGGDPKATKLVPWFNRSGNNMHDINIMDNVVTNFNYAGQTHGFNGASYLLRGSSISDSKINNNDYSNLTNLNNLSKTLKNLTIKNMKFENSSAYETAGYDENQALFTDGDFIHSTNLIAKVDHFYWGSANFANQMPAYSPIDPRTTGNVVVYSDQAPSATIVSPVSNLSNIPSRMDDKFMQVYIKRRVLNSPNDLKNIEVMAAPAQGKQLAGVYVTIQDPNGMYLTNSGVSASKQSVEAILSANGNYVVTLTDLALSKIVNGQYTLTTYAIGNDGISSGTETKNFLMQMDTSKPLPPINVYQPTAARTATTIDLVWDKPADYQAGDTYNVYYRKLTDGNSYTKAVTNYILQDGANSSYSVYALKAVAPVSTNTNSVQLKGLAAKTAYSVFVTTVRNGVESPLSKYALANTKFTAATVNILNYGASTAAADNTQAIQNAINAAPANGIVQILAGTFVTGALFLKNNVTLQLDAGAVLKAFTNFDFSSYPTQDAAIAARYPMIQTDKGLSFASLINIGNAMYDASIIGSGTIDPQYNVLQQYGSKIVNSAITIINATDVYAQGINILANKSTAIRSINSKNIAQYGVTTLPDSSNANLSSLSLSSVPLSPVFASGTTNYTATVANNVSSTAVTAAVYDVNAIMKVNGVTLPSGSNSQAINLNVGSNLITVLVTAQDGTSKVYTVNVTRQGNKNASLSNLSLSNGALSPAFASGTTNYTATVANNVSSVTVTAAVYDTNATMKVNGTALPTGSISQAIALNVGNNTITVLVTAQDGTTQPYTINVTRQSNYANLSNLSVVNVPLSPAFASGTTNYTATVSYYVSSVNVTAAVYDANASMKVNGVALPTGSISQGIDLNVGSNLIMVLVTAQDGTIQTYSVNVIRNGGGSSSSSGSSPAPVTPEPTATETQAPKATTGDGKQASEKHIFTNNVNNTQVVSFLKDRITQANASSAANNLSDTANHWSKDTVNLFVKLGIVTGYEDGSFHPDASITRAEFATLISKVFNVYTEPASSKSVFSDVDGRFWANEAIKALASRGIINGYEDGTFQPDKTITRAEIIAIISRVVNVNEVKKDSRGALTDISGSWNAAQIQAAFEAGLVQGRDASTFAPDASSTKAESLTLILRVLELNPDINSLLNQLKR
ncbi:cadherin-like beta sandwich domain-containing protein [Paenibacillus cremeus]|nr:cadherin-like beta sandwich domain-containing protein [Paenibacillus cremeus]